jgi:acetyl/propionyl-CoA carboxylase alpha subunit
MRKVDARAVRGCGSTAASARLRARSATTSCCSKNGRKARGHIEVQVFGDSHG